MPGLYCLGDACSSGWELTPVAIGAGRRLADRLFGGAKEAKFDLLLLLGRKTKLQRQTNL